MDDDFYNSTQNLKLSPMFNQSGWIIWMPHRLFPGIVFKWDKKITLFYNYNPTRILLDLLLPYSCALPSNSPISSDIGGWSAKK